jgi:CRISPR-associated protein (TIGR03986 family)
LADRSNLREEYQSRMSSYDRRARRAQYNFSVGLLLKSGKKEPGLHFEIKSSGGNFRQIYKDEAQDMVQAIGGKYAEFNFYRVNEGYLVVSGDMPNKKRDWLISEPPDNAEIIEIPPEDVRSYNDDRTRDERVPNLLELARQKENEKGVPCFYVRWQDASGKDRVSFGHTGMFRLAYEKNIGDHVVTVSHRIDDQTLQKLQDELPEISFIKLQQFKNKEFTESELANILDREKLKKNEIGKILQACAKIDFAEAIFGNEKTHSGRVFFEDAFLIDEQGDPQLEAQTPQILSAPKPTTFQHYLVQNSDEVKQLNHYNSNTIIRGYKIYWHKSGERERWVEKDRKVIERNPKQYTEIKPVKAGTKFRGRIRFENLSDKELGALLFALDLPEGCGHKLGMGKPLGLGSVRITPKLYLSKRAQRYKDFFAEVWDNKIEASALETLKKFKDAFSKYVLQKLGEDSSKLLWETGRLRELLVMLRFDVGRELERTGANRYMTIAPQNEFKNRYVLPKATGLVSISKLEEALAQLKSETVIAKEKITHIKKIEITGLWDKFNLKWQLDQDASILVGINGSGKTTILELITHALAGEYEDSDKVKYPPQEFIIFFNNGEQLKYRRRELMAKPSFRLLPEFISTFDIILDKADRDGTSKAGAQIGRQLTEKLMERIARFYFELKLLPAEFDPKPCIDDFIGIVKKVFHQTKKQIELAGEFVIRQSDGQILMPDQLSAGEKQILIIMLTALILKLRSVANADQRYLLIMDEPENSLHLRWQKLLIGYVRRLNENTQIIIATHAPAIIKKGWLKNTTEMNQIKSAMGA